MSPDKVVQALKALAQESRLSVFRQLVRAAPDGLTPGDLSGELAIAPATLSFHLKELAWAGLIERRQQGRNIHYTANLHNMFSLMGFLTTHYCSSACDEAGMVFENLVKNARQPKEQALAYTIKKLEKGEDPSTST